MGSDWDDETARWYLERYGDHALNRIWLEHIDLSPNDFLLDVGCGGGASIMAAMPHLPEGRATGIDPMPVMVAAARERLPGTDFYEAEAEAIPLPGGVVDVVLANCSVIHWRDVTAGLREVHRVLKPGGQFLALEEAFASQDEEGRLKSPQDLPDLLSAAGFEVAAHGHHTNGDESYWATRATKAR